MDDLDDRIIKENSAVSDAIKSLISVESTKKAKDSEVELKTDLLNDEVRGHAVLSVLNKFIEMDSEQFSAKCIIGELVDKKERKAWSKDRKSRSEIVMIAKQPEFPQDFQNDARKQGLFNRLFTPKQKAV